MDTATRRLPSILTGNSRPLFLLLSLRTTFVFSGKTSGRKESERGLMGVISRDFTSGWTMLPPADRE